MAHAYSTNALLTKNFELYDFKDEWEESFGKPAKGGVWIIYGDSGSGKTTFALQLCKYMTNFGRVAYNSLEQGFSQSMKHAYKLVGMDEVSKKILLLDKEPIDVLHNRLKKKKSPEIIVIDSLQYSLMKYKDYINLKDSFRRKTFIFISHFEGNQIVGATARRVKFDSDVKVHVDRYRAFITTSRFGGEQKPFDVWKEKADEYWNNEL